MVNKKTQVLSEKQATLLMPSSAKILLTVHTKSLCLVGMQVLLICKADDFQIDKPLPASAGARSTAPTAAVDCKRCKPVHCLST